MITLLGSLLGFLGSFVPDLFKTFQRAQDNKHELAMFDKQLEMLQAQGAIKMQEIGAQADIAESVAVHQPMQITGIHWLDALNGTVRPVLAYAFFMLYAAIKICQFHMIKETPWALWTEEDGAVFAAIVSFYFGGRAMAKFREK